MTAQKEAFVLPNTGTKVIVLLAEPWITVLEAEVQPGGGAGRHRHTKEDETIIVLEGSLTVSGQRLKSMDALRLPAGVAHDFQNSGTVLARALFVCIPGGLERFFRAVVAGDAAKAAAAGIEAA